MPRPSSGRLPTHRSGSPSKGTHRTPRALIKALSREFRLVVDVAATKDTAIWGATHYFGPGHLNDRLADALLVDWPAYFRRFFGHPGDHPDAALFMNPPWSKDHPIDPWIAKARGAAIAHGVPVVAVLPASVQTRWWARDIHNRAHEVRFFPHRLSYDDADGNRQANADFNSAVVIWRSLDGYSRFRTNYSYWTYRQED